MTGPVPAINVAIRRVYEPPAPEDGTRVLVDRLWPRGLTKAQAAIDLWAKEVAPSTELRKWFGHDPARWAQFEQRYRRELASRGDVLDDLRERARAGRITLVHDARDEVHNDAVVLRVMLVEG